MLIFWIFIIDFLVLKILLKIDYKYKINYLYFIVDINMFLKKDTNRYILL